MQIACFGDVANVLVRPTSILHPDASKSTWVWTFLDAYNRTLLEHWDTGANGRTWGFYAELAYAKFHAAKLMGALEGEGMRIWCGQPCYVHIAKGMVEIQQLGRRDVVPAKDITKSTDDAGFDIVLRANQIGEARFFTCEVPNRALLDMCLMISEAKIKV